MDDVARIRGRLDEGEYFQAIAVHPEAPKLAVDTAAARLSQAHPELAGVLSCIAQVLTDPARARVYWIAYELRDAVLRALRDRFGDDWFDFVPACVPVVWRECQRLLACRFEMADVKMGEQGAASLAGRGVEWVIESVVNQLLPVLAPAPVGEATITLVRPRCWRCGGAREVCCEACGGTGTADWGADDLGVAVFADDLEDLDDLDDDARPLCPECGGEGRIACDCVDDYTFAVPPDAAPGSVVMGLGERTNRMGYMVLERKVDSPRPHLALAVLYRMEQLGTEATLEQIEACRKLVGLFMVLAYVVPAAAVGALAGCWPTAVLTAAVVGVVSYAGGARRLQRLFTRAARASRAPHAVLVLLPLGLGPLVGSLLSTWRAGLGAGAIVSATSLVLVLAGRRFNVTFG